MFIRDWLPEAKPATARGPLKAFNPMYIMNPAVIAPPPPTI